MVAALPAPFPAGTDCEIEVRRLWSRKTSPPAGAERGRPLDGPGHAACHRGRLAHRALAHRRRRGALVRDVGLAEELAQDALIAALEHWPQEGVPDNPGPG